MEKSQTIKIISLIYCSPYSPFQSEYFLRSLAVYLQCYTNVHMVLTHVHTCILFYRKGILFKKRLYSLIPRERGREGEKHQCVVASRASHWGHSRQPRHVPWLGVEPMTLRFAGRHSIHWTCQLGQEKGYFLSVRFVVFFLLNVYLIIFINCIIFHVMNMLI